MKVLMFGWEFPPHNFGGLGVACYGLTKSLAKLGVDLTFVLPKETPITAKFLKVDFAKVPDIKAIAVSSPIHGYITSDLFDERAKKFSMKGYGQSLLAEVLRYGEMAGSLATKDDYDLIHAHDWLSLPAGVQAKKTSGKPLVVHIHATEFDRSGGRGVNQAVYEIEKAGVTVADHVIAVSNLTKQTLIDKYFVPPDKISVVHNGIVVDEYEAENFEFEEAFTALKKAGNKIVLFVGRFSIQKNPVSFIRAANRVLAHLPNTVFVMVGAGEMQPEMMELAASLGISDRVLFPGFLRGEQLNRVYRTADIFVMPSISEPFGIVPLEAMINKTPVIISKQSGVSEVINNALKVDFWDEDELTNLMVGTLQHSPVRKTLSENGHREVKRITWDKAAEKTVRVYKEIIKNK